MKPKNIYVTLLIKLLIAGTIISCNNNEPVSIRETIDLKGEWQFKLDTANVGISEKWYFQDFSDSVLLPGTLDENKKGWKNKDTSEYHLNREYVYFGPAWFKKEVEIPESWKDKHIELIMERTKVTQVWIDSLYLGTNNTIFSKQVYDLTDKINPGKHYLTIIVDNTFDLVPVAGSHAYEENTQTNWNGIIGIFCLEASNKLRLHNIRVYPDINEKQIKVITDIENPDKLIKNIKIQLKAGAWNTNKKHSVLKNSYVTQITGQDTSIEMNYRIGDDMQLWSEFNPVLYKLEVVLLDENGITLDDDIIDFGMREFKTEDAQFTINSIKTFLRGKHDACVFPLTGYPPMDTAGWTRVFRIVKSYGINHYRYHSWCPPEAAFMAADIVGIYLQPELPIWWFFNATDSGHVAFMMKEGYCIMDNYGNHASFVMFALGNELFQERDSLKKMVAKLRAYDDRPIYAQGSNNRLWNPSYAEGDDFWVTFRTSKEKEDLSSDVRASISFLDSRMGDGGIINTLYPSTSKTYTKAIEGSPVPVIGHEIGQYQVYPNYKAELDKYTGVLKPWNLIKYREYLKANNLADKEEDFFKASGALSVICYREDIEMAIRTPGFGGFQLLDLQDFPGQGTALVGMLDAFMDSKGLISPEEFRHFCNDVVILLIMDKYCWKNNELFNAEIQIANYGETDLLNKTINWEISSNDNKYKKTGTFSFHSIPQGKIITIGNIETDLKEINNAQKLTIKLKIEDTKYITEYPFWIYPSDISIQIPEGINLTTKIDKKVINQLNDGEKVLLFPDHKTIEKNSVEGMFITDFWNYRMFKNLALQYGGRVSPGTMGILTDPSHPVFNEFPTEFHTNWQWWIIVKNSRPIILDEIHKEYKPIVQIIDNINRNYKLGLIFEFKVGKGRLLICSSNLPELEDKPEARQLYESILKYMESDSFNPEFEISFERINKLLY